MVVRHTKLSFLAACLLTFSTAFSQPQSAFEKHSYVTNGYTLPYRLLSPDTLEPGKTYPLILFLHGSGERGEDNELNLAYISDLLLDSGYRQAYPAFALVPQCPSDERWAPEDWFGKPTRSSAAVIELLDSIVSIHPVDTRKLYVMGLSMGGYGTWYLITRFPDKFAAAIPVCGGGDWNQASAIRHVPVWVFHGRKDEVVSVEQSRKMVHALRKAGGKPRYTEYRKIRHDSWTPAFHEPELMPWLFSNSLSTMQ